MLNCDYILDSYYDTSNIKEQCFKRDERPVVRMLGNLRRPLYFCVPHIYYEGNYDNSNFVIISCNNKAKLQFSLGSNARTSNSKFQIFPIPLDF